MKKILWHSAKATTLLSKIEHSEYILSMKYKFFLQSLSAYGGSVPILFALIFLSCTYEPAGSNVVTVTVPAPNINLVVLNEQSINMLRGEVTISYSALVGQKKVRSVQLYLNDNLMSTGSGPDGYITFNTNGRPDGNYTLTLQLITSTNSGSLADHAGGEAFIFTKEYETYIYNGAVTPSEINNFTIENGAAVIHWNKYTQPGFQKYVLKDYSHIVIAEITDVNTTAYSDHSLVGGTKQYRLETVVAGYAFGGNTTTTYFSPALTVTSSVVDTDKILIRWSKNPYFAAFSKYQILRGSSYILAEISSINDTTFVDNDPIFGGTVMYTVSAVSNNGISVEMGYTTVPIWAKRTKPFTLSSHFEYLPQSNRFLIYWNTYCSLIDGTSMQTTQTGNFLNNNYIDVTAIDMSDNGSWLYYISNIDMGEFRKLNPSSLQTEQTYTMNAISGITQEGLFGLCVSDSNQVYALTGSLAYTQAKLHVIDMNQGKVLSVINSTNDYNLQITPNGKYIINASDLFTFHDTILTRIGTIDRTAKFLSTNDRLVQINGFSLQIVNCSDASVIKEIPLPVDRWSLRIDVDKKTGYVGVESETGLYFIVDVNDGTIKKTIPIQVGGDFFGYRLQNGYLFVNGFYKKVNL